jgi:uncharacterized membrane protein
MWEKLRTAAQVGAVLSMHLRLGEHLRRRFVTGLLLLAPLALTFLALKVAFDFLDGLLQPLIVLVAGKRIPGVGLAGLLLLVYLMGLVGALGVGRRLIAIVQALILGLPIVSSVYSIFKQLTDVLSGGKTTEGSKRVVIVEYPRAGIWSIGFLMAFTKDENGRAMAVVFIPNAPLPNSGWTIVLPSEDVYETDMPMQEATQLVLSGGIVAPAQIAKRPMHQGIVETLRAQLAAQEQELETRRRELEEYSKSLPETPASTAAAVARDVEANREPEEGLRNGGNQSPQGRGLIGPWWRRGERRLSHTGPPLQLDEMK